MTTLVLLAAVIAMATQVIGDNVARAFSMVDAIGGPLPHGGHRSRATRNWRSVTPSAINSAARFAMACCLFFGSLAR